MSNQDKKADNREERASGAIEDLTVNEIESGDVKGGAVDMILRIVDVKGESRDHK